VRLATPTVVELLHRADFPHLRVTSNRANAARLARFLHRPELAMNAADEDAIFEPPLRDPRRSPLFATRFSSVKAAKRADAAGRPYAQRQERVCNVVLSSFDSGRDPTLAVRVDRAVNLLRNAC